MVRVRRRRVVAVGSLVVLLSGLTGIAAPAFAGSYDDQRRDAERRATAADQRAARVRDSVEGLSVELGQAVLAVQATQARLPAAQAELATAREAFERSQRESARVASRLQDARAQKATAAVSTAATSASASVVDRHDDADIEFAPMVIEHRGALAMAQLAVERSNDPSIQGLAETIVATHASELDVMASWLTAWGVEVRDASSMPATDRDTAMLGVVTDQEMRALGDAAGPVFDQLFLSLMIEHHEGTIAMARIEGMSGESTKAVNFAATIVRDQTAETAEMRSILPSATELAGS